MARRVTLGLCAKCCSAGFCFPGRPMQVTSRYGGWEWSQQGREGQKRSLREGLGRKSRDVKGVECGCVMCCVSPSCSHDRSSHIYVTKWRFWSQWGAGSGRSAVGLVGHNGTMGAVLCQSQLEISSERRSVAGPSHRALVPKSGDKCLSRIFPLHLLQIILLLTTIQIHFFLARLQLNP